MECKKYKIDSVEEIGEFDDYVYDIEVDDDTHTFFANDILVHNSIYFDCSPIVKEILGDVPERLKRFSNKNVKLIAKDILGFVENTVNKYCFEELVQKKMFSTLDRIEFKLENFCPTGIFLAKKRYILNIRYDEGAICDKFKYVGVEMKKTEIPVYIRDFLKKFVEDSIRENWSYTQVYDFISDFWKEYQQMGPNAISFFRGLGTEKLAEGFLKVEKGALVHARAAIYYNQLIDKYNLGGTYEKIVVGDRFRFFWTTTENKYNIDCFAFKDEMPKEFENEFQIDYRNMFEKTVLKPLDKIFSASGWKMFNPTEEILQGILDL